MGELVIEDRKKGRHRISQKEAWKRIRTGIRLSQSQNWSDGCCHFIEDLRYHDLISEKVADLMFARLEHARRKRRGRKPTCNHYVWPSDHVKRLAWIQEQIDSL
jgi:hypothetical protein